MARIGKRIRVVETGGIKLKDVMIRSDLTGCLLCRDGAHGNHTRRGGVYRGTCTLCGHVEVVARYDGETGHSAYQRINMGHKVGIVNRNLDNAFAKHLHIHHPEHVGDDSVFQFSLSAVSKSCLIRQITEGVLIHNSDADIQLNGKSEWHQPSTRRVEFSQEPRQRSRASGSK